MIVLTYSKGEITPKPRREVLTVLTGGNSTTKACKVSKSSPSLAKSRTVSGEFEILIVGRDRYS
jgi:hypothetical protein